jgi:hypothetical protein
LLRSRPAAGHFRCGMSPDTRAARLVAPSAARFAISNIVSDGELREAVHKPNVAAGR